MTQPATSTRKNLIVQLIVHRGTHEIGGSCVELRTASTRLILDVGLPLVDADREPFDQRRIRGKSIDELITEGTVPNVPGLFIAGPPPDAVLLSHCHLDHVGLLKFIKPDIPIHASKGTSQMMLAGAVFSQQQSLDKDQYREVKSGQNFTIGDFTVTPFPVDHSSYGANAFLLEANGQSLLYSGDLRMHGRKPGMVKDLMADVGPKNINVLLMEGTHFGSNRTEDRNEYQLEKEILEHIKDAPALVLAAFSPIDVDRLVTYYKATQKAGRIFVADAYTAFVMHLVSGESGVPSPKRKSGIRVLFNKAFRNRKHESMEKRFVADQITLDEMLTEPSKYTMVFRPSMTKLDFDGTLPQQSRCLYSYWKGYLTKPDWVELQRQLNEINGDFIPAHTSGHIYVKDIIRFVKAINAQTVIPIHTFEPEQYHEHFSNVRVLEDGEIFEVD